MRQIVLFCLIAAVLLLGTQQQCLSANCNNLVEISPQVEEIIEKSEKEIRKSFWYYLRNSKLIYSTVFISAEEYFFFFIHRNIVGTFQTVSSFDRTSRKHSIKNMVRLGSGSSPDIEVSGETPMDFSPNILSIQLKPDEYLVTKNSKGQFEIVGANINQQDPEPLITDARSRLPQIDQAIRTQFPQYLNASNIINQETILTTHRVYFLITYINEQGLFLAIGSDKALEEKQINTFVKLAKGSKPQSSMQPSVLEPKVIEIK